MTAPTSPAPTSPTRLGRGRAVRAAIAVIAVLVLVGGGAAAVSAATSHGSSTTTSHGYRTATVTRESVAQTLDNVGLIEPVAQASVAFPTGGTVQSVLVKVGDTVALGDKLATLNLASLNATLTTDEASLASAKLTLYEALNGEPITASTGANGSFSGGSGSGGSGTGGTGASATTASFTQGGSGISLAADYTFTPPTSTTVPGATPTTTTPASTTTTVPSGGHTHGTGTGTGTGTGAGGSSAKLAAAEQAVLNGQKKVDADLAIASRDLATANKLCGTSTNPTPPTTVPSTTTTTTPGTTTTTAPTGATDPAACAAALQQELEDQQAVAADQNALARASTALDKLIAASATTGTRSTTGTGTGTSRTGTGSSHTSTGSSGRTGTGTSTSTSTPTAAQLIQYQAAVDTAELQVEVAQQGIAQATIETPIGGTVVAVNLQPGASVTAGSSTEDIVVQGSGGYEVSTTVTVNDVSKVELGQSATVLPDGLGHAIDGKVVAIGIADDTSGNTPTYPVVVGFTGDPAGLRNGATADVSIVIDHSASSLAVPTSAVTTTGTRHTVTVLAKGKAVTTTVEIGAVGSTYTAVTSGLTQGQVVVLADLSQPLPSSATSSSTNTSTSRNGRTGTGTGTGGFGGGGFGGGGFGGGGSGGNGRGGG